jgi:hypothetical protein
MADGESLFSELDKKAKQASDRQREKKKAKINQKVESTKKGQSIF